MNDREVVALIAAYGEYEAEYGKRLANHLPMALWALHRLGAGEERLRAHATRYVRGLVPLRTPHPGPVDAVALRGRTGNYATLRAHFAVAVAAAGIGPFLRTALPDLLPGLAAGAFHGVIRIAYGVASEHAGEVAAGTAYLADAWLPLGALPPAGAAATTDVCAALAAVAARCGGPARALKQHLAGNIFERMAQLSREPLFAAALPALAWSAVPDLRSFAHAALRFHERQRSFTSLHCVTAVHALRVLRPFVPPQALHGWLWQALCAAFLSEGAPLLAGPDPAGVPPPWPAIAARALASDDEHVWKLVFTCREEEAHWGEPRHRALAAAAAGAC